MIFESEGWGSLELNLSENKRSFYKPDTDLLPKFKISGFNFKSFDIEPFYFFEWQTFQYSFIIDKKNCLFEPPFELRINQKRVKSTESRGNSYFMSGSYAFEDQAGETQIEIRDRLNRQIFQLNAEVFPQKMDYRSDFRAMLSEISEIIHNLAFDSLKDTFRRSRAKVSGSTTEIEWWNILDAIFEELLLSLNVIRRMAKHEIRIEEKILPVNKIKGQISNKPNWFLKNNRFSNNQKQGIKINEQIYYSHALSSKKHVSYDTYENRFVCWAVKNIIEKLRRYRIHIENSDKKQQYTVISNRIIYFQGRLQGIINSSPFNEVSEFEKRSYFSTSLTKGSGYRDFLQLYLILSRGLELEDNDIFKIEQKDISKLYEYWCFLALVKIAKEEMGLEMVSNSIIRIQSSKVKVELKKGKESEIKLKDKTTGEEVSLYFNRNFNKDNIKIFTYEQIPDITVRFTKDGFKKDFWYIFDAKYRFDGKTENSSGEKEYNVPQDAIGQLHRYRDVILHSEPTNSAYRTALKNLGGIILYPYPKSENDFLNNVFFKSIEQVNIGALPFLPSKTRLLSSLFKRLIRDASGEELSENIINSDQTEYIEKINSWSDWVIIGSIPKENQPQRIQFLETTNKFHIPYVVNSQSRLYTAKNLLVIIAGTNNATLFKINNWEILYAKELEQIGANWQLSNQKYLVFNLEVERKLITPDAIAPTNYRFASLEGLNRYFKNTDDDKYSFYLTSAYAYNLYRFLKKSEINFSIHWMSKEQDNSLIKFIVEDIQILSSQVYRENYFKIDDKDVTLKDVIKLLESKQDFNNNSTI